VDDLISKEDGKPDTPRNTVLSAPKWMIISSVVAKNFVARQGY
jgi:hypothetical protein